MKNSVKRTISLLASLILLVGSIFAYSFFIKPEYQLVNQLRGTLVAKANLFTDQQTIIAEVEELLSQFESAARIQEIVSLSLPLKESESGIFSQLQALAQANDLVIEVLSVQSLPTKSTAKARGVKSMIKDLGVLQILAKLSGSYENFKRFLQGVETNIRVMDLVSLKIEKDGRKQELFEFNIALNAYYQT